MLDIKLGELQQKSGKLSTKTMIIHYKFLRDFDAGYSCWSGIPDKPINLSTPDNPLPANLINPDQLDIPSTV